MQGYSLSLEILIQVGQRSREIAVEQQDNLGAKISVYKLWLPLMKYCHIQSKATANLWLALFNTVQSDKFPLLIKLSTQ